MKYSASICIARYRILLGGMAASSEWHLSVMLMQMHRQMLSILVDFRVCTPVQFAITNESKMLRVTVSEEQFI